MILALVETVAEVKMTYLLTLRWVIIQLKLLYHMPSAKAQSHAKAHEAFARMA